MAERTPAALRTAPGPQAPDPPDVRARGSRRDRAEACPQRQRTVGRVTGGQVALLAAGREVLTARDPAVGNRAQFHAIRWYLCLLTLLACREPPEGRYFSRARDMEHVRFVSRSRVSRRHIVSAYDAQSRSLEGFEQLRAGPQTEVFRQVGKDQPSLTARLQMLRQRRQK